MNIDDRIALAKDLIRKREEIDRQLAELFAGGAPRRQKCSICGSPDHTARSCPQRSPPASGPPPTPASPVSSTPFSMLSSLTQQDDGAADL